MPERDLDQQDTRSTKGDEHVLDLLLRFWWSICRGGDRERTRCELRVQCEGTLSW